MLSGGGFMDSLSRRMAKDLERPHRETALTCTSHKSPKLSLQLHQGDIVGENLLIVKVHVCGLEGRLFI